MKTAAIAFAALVAVAAADSKPVQPAAVTATPTPAPSVATNATTGHGAQIQAWRRDCYQPSGAPENWYRLTKGDGPHSCWVPPLQSEWSMLKSYRDGGIQNVHWKYTDNVNDPECLENWTYHAADGRTVKTYVSGRTTTYGQNRRWCGLPVYNDGGVEGYQWAYCKCDVYNDRPRPDIIGPAPAPVRD